jgi:GNAT superfamily N-acetyltransferase
VGEGEPSGSRGLARELGTLELVIRDWSSSDSIPELTHLLHAAYAHLAQRGLRYVATHQDDIITARRLGRGFPLVAYLHQELVATATLYPPRPDSPVPWYRRADVCHFGQFGVRPDRQRNGIGARILRELERRARVRGASELACDTAEQAEHLRSWYDCEGYRFIAHTQWAITNFRSVVLSKSLDSPP